MFSSGLQSPPIGPALPIPHFSPGAPGLKFTIVISTLKSWRGEGEQGGRSGGQGMRETEQ